MCSDREPRRAIPGHFFERVSEPFYKLPACFGTKLFRDLRSRMANDRKGPADFSKSSVATAATAVFAAAPPRIGVGAPLMRTAKNPQCLERLLGCLLFLIGSVWSDREGAIQWQQSKEHVLTVAHIVTVILPKSLFTVLSAPCCDILCGVSSWLTPACLRQGKNKMPRRWKMQIIIIFSKRQHFKSPKWSSIPLSIHKLVTDPHAHPTQPPQ